MSLPQAVEERPGRVIIIDDKYLPIDFEFISESALTVFFQTLESSQEFQKTFSQVLGLPPDAKLEDLINTVQENYSVAYEAYTSGNHQYLEPLFSELAEEKLIDVRRLNILESVLFEFFKVKPIVFGSVEEARAHISDSSLVFLDFFLGGVNSQEEARKVHSSVSKELAQAVVLGGLPYPKLVVLMSTSLPDTQGLAHFRGDTGIRSAFFHSIDKNNFEHGYLSTFISDISTSYESALKLNNYLVAVQNEIKSVAEQLVGELQQRLDLHDLTILKTLRLDGESDTPQAYLTHLLSEVMAARLRVSPALRAEVLPEETAYGDVLFDGKVLPSSVLFEFFADIAVAPTPLDGTFKVAFGDIFEVTKGEDAGKLYLVISPACDLQRSDDDYEVLCVPGSANATADSLEKLLAGRYAFGEGNVVMRMPQTPAPQFKRFVFDWKALRTIKMTSLKVPEEFIRQARMAEIFAQEVKTKALNHAARVGVPVDPSFSLGLKAKVRFSYPAGRGEQRISGEMPGLNDSYLCAVLAMGKEKDGALERTVMFSSQFKAALQTYIDQCRERTPHTKLDKVAEYFAKPTSYKFAFDGSKNQKKFEDSVVIKFQEKIGSLTEASGFEICLYIELETDKDEEGADIVDIERGKVSSAETAKPRRPE